MHGPLPHILEQPLIPQPLHGVNPRSIMGVPAWNIQRKKIYAKHNFRCAACGTSSRKAILKPWLEAHELFEIDWQTQTMTLTGMEPLCHACHAFVHCGLLNLRLHHRKISEYDVACILGNGVGVLEEIGGIIPIAAHAMCNLLDLKHDLQVAKNPPATDWVGWKMVWNETTYPSPYPSETAWERAMEKLPIY